MPREFTTPHGGTWTMLTAEESYAEGLATGRDWQWSYTPGGPWVPCTGFTSIGTAARRAMEENHAHWMRGFHDGVAERAHALPPSRAHIAGS